MSSLLQAENLGCWYGEVVGLSDLDLDLPPGVYGLLGPNGAGKTTFLRLIVGELKPSRGELRVLGEAPFASRALHSQLGWAPQRDRMYEDQSALQFVTFLMRLHGEPKRRARELGERALERVGLKDSMKRRITGFSKGMRQRVRLAQAIAHEPRLLVVDEPLTGLDPLGRRATIELFRELQAAGTSILVSSHVLHEVETLTQEVVLLHRGRLLARGEVREIRALLDGRPMRLAIEAHDPRKLATHLFGFEGVKSVQIDEARGRLAVETEDAASFQVALTEFAGDTEHAAGIQSMEHSDSSLEAVFDYLMEARR